MIEKIQSHLTPFSHFSTDIGTLRNLKSLSLVINTKMVYQPVPKTQLALTSVTSLFCQTFLFLFKTGLASRKYEFHFLIFLLIHPHIHLYILLKILAAFFKPNCFTMLDIKFLHIDVLIKTENFLSETSNVLYNLK